MPASNKKGVVMQKDEQEISKVLHRDIKTFMDIECDWCNGYGSSLHETDQICTKCGGTGLNESKSKKEREKL